MTNNQHTSEELSKSINISFFFIQKQLELYDNLANTTLFRQNFKRAAKLYAEELERFSNSIVLLAKELDQENYKNELNKLHIFSTKLDVFLGELYEEFEN